jgi:hypothetical protein
MLHFSCFSHFVGVTGLGVDVDAVAVVRPEDGAEEGLEEADVGVVQDRVGERQRLLRLGQLFGLDIFRYLISSLLKTFQNFCEISNFFTPNFDEF